MNKCLKSATISILVNGSLTKKFIPPKTLRQGISLTIFMFIIYNVKRLAWVVR